MHPVETRKETNPETTFNFVLQPEFPLNALVIASEALRIANQNSGRNFFEWRFVSENGGPVRASNGMWLSVDCDIDAMPNADFLMVFEGNLPTQRNSPRLLSRIRAASRFGATVGAVDTGAFALMQAGIVGEAGVVVHWEAVPALRERFADVVPLDQIYQIDEKVLSCAGGIATLDLMLDLIGRRQSPILADEVANALVHTPRSASSPQRLDRPVERVAAPSMADRVVALMETNLDFPLSLEEIAGELGVSPRTVSRECLRRFGETPMRFYLRIRLQAARNLLFYEEFTMKHVALACGFSYPSALSRAFKRQFGQSPRAFRATLRQRQSQQLRPEIRRLAGSAPAYRSREP